MMKVVTTTVTAAAAASQPLRQTPDTSITTVQNYIQRCRHSIFDRFRKHLQQPRHGRIAPLPSSSTGTTTTRISGRTKRKNQSVVGTKNQSVVGTKLTFRSPTKERLTKWYCCDQPHGPQYTTDDPSVEMTNSLVHTTSPH